MPRIDMAAADRFWSRRAEAAARVASLSIETGPSVDLQKATDIAPPAEPRGAGPSFSSPVAEGPAAAFDALGAAMVACDALERPICDPPAPAPLADQFRAMLVASTSPIDLPVAAAAAEYTREDGTRMVEIGPGQFVSRPALARLTGRDLK